MSNYYYLVAQLPSLSYGQSAPMSSESYLELCRQLLGAEDMAAMEAGLATGSTGDAGTEDEGAHIDPFWTDYRAWDRALRLNLALSRAQKQQKAPPPDVPSDPMDAVSAARAASGSPSVVGFARRRIALRRALTKRRRFRTTTSAE
jgi:hypothetical protein